MSLEELTALPSSFPFYGFGVSGTFLRNMFLNHRVSSLRTRPQH